MTSALGLKLKEAIETNEARKAMAQWNKPTTPMTTITPTPVSICELAFNMVRDNPGKTKAQIVELLEKQGHKATSTTSMLSMMIRYGLIIQEDKILRAVGTKYKSRVEFNPRLKQRLGPKPKNRKVTEQKKEIRMIIRPQPEVKASDAVNSPAHYTVGGIETIDFIEAKQLSYNLGNVVKYLTRADHKGNQLQDLQKAQWYLTREIERVQS